MTTTSRIRLAVWLWALGYAVQEWLLVAFLPPALAATGGIVARRHPLETALATLCAFAVTAGTWIVLFFWAAAHGALD